MQASQSPVFDDCPDEEALWQYAAVRSSNATAGSAHDPTNSVAAHIHNCSLCIATLNALHNDVGSEALAQAAPFDSRYVLGRKLGTGASSIVYCARDQRLGTDVALKIFRDVPAERIKQELLLSRKITHENVCRVFDSGVSPDGAYLAMEYVDGVTLEGRIAQGSRIAELRMWLKLGFSVPMSSYLGACRVHLSTCWTELRVRCSVLTVR